MKVFMYAYYRLKRCKGCGMASDAFLYCIRKCECGNEDVMNFENSKHRHLWHKCHCPAKQDFAC